jgi:uncharacterized membrane protein
MELITIIALTLLLVPLVLLTTGVLRIVLAIICLLFFPGYALLAVLFPQKNRLTGLERVVLSLVMSFAIVSLIALILNFTPGGIRLETICIAITFFNLAASIAALIRRRRLYNFERFEVSFSLKMPRWRRGGKLNITLSAILLLLILGSIWALVYVTGIPKAEEPYTDFYILGSEGKVEDYPRELVLGEPAEVPVGIVNHEGQNKDYTIEIRINGEKVQEIKSINLADQEDWQTTIILVPDRAGKSQKIDFLLYKNGGSEPYLKLYLRLDVIES